MSLSETLPTLFSKHTAGKIKIWRAFVKAPSKTAPAFLIVEYGQEGGKITHIEKEITSGKNIGKKNETTPFEQALVEAKAKWNKQKDKGYIENKGDLESQVHVSPMLAKKYEEDGAKIKYPAMVQRKYDGVRCIAYLDEEGNVQLMSRTGKPWHFFENIRSEILKAKFFETAMKTLGLKSKTSFYIDGELYTDKVPFEELVGICRKEKDLSPEEEKEAKLMEYHIYDCWSLDDKKLEYEFLGRGTYWADAGTSESLLEISTLINLLQSQPGLLIGSPEEASFQMQNISKAEFCEIVKGMPNSSYTESLVRVVNNLK